MVQKLRRRLLVGFLAVLAGLALFDGQARLQTNAAPVQPARSGPGGGGSQRAATTIAEILPRSPGTPGGDAFEVRSWAVPEPIRAAPPVRPSAPPLPFTFLGKKYEDGAWQVFIDWQEGVYLVREKDALGGLYRVESIRPPSMTVTYLPLHQTQTLSIGEAP